MPPEPNFINMDGHDHMVRRAVVADWFTPKRVRTLEEHIREVVVGLIEAAKVEGDVCFIDALAGKVPLRLIGEMLGYPLEDLDQLAGWLDVYVQGGCGADYVTEEISMAFMEFTAYHLMAVAQRKEVTTDDLLSVWMHALIDGEPLDDEEILFEHTLILVGGAESTRNVISGGMKALLANPDQLAWLREHPEGIPNAVEEFVRWTSPFISMSRTVTKDTVFSGQALEEDDEVLMIYPAANRDPAAFPNPEVFDIRREWPNKPIAFGYGAHHCLGAALARMEIRVVLEELMKRVEHIELIGECVYKSSSFLRGMTHMPVRLG
jgi:cytochrome P450 family 142 subfamily A polypeptide 1